MIERDWYGLYGNGWKSGTELTSEAFGHPAKFSRSLIRRIYEHCLEQGYLQPGDVVLDPFGGVGLGGIDAVQNDLRWVGVELEQPFNDMGAGCDCTGISKADWVRFYGRWDRARYQGERYWCPRCLAEAKRISAPDNGQLSFLDKPPSTSYVRNSGKIPHTEPHHYTGNIELWGNGSAALLQGDSRFLCDVLSEAGGVVSSPPYAGNRFDGGEESLKQKQGFHKGYSKDGGYGENTTGQLAVMPQGDWQAVVSSPPYMTNTVHGRHGLKLEKFKEPGRVGKTSHAIGPREMDDYGTTPGQLGSMRLISSPPYAESLASDDPDKRGGLYRDPKRRGDKTLTAEYGESAGQLGAMKVVSSPPYEQVGVPDHKGQTDFLKDGKFQGGGESFLYAEYGNTDGNIGNSQGDDFWTAARQIMYQVARLLPPDAVAVWVLKAFVRNKEIVDFPNQWRALGENCGFETVELIKAWLVEDKGAQYTLDGELEHKTVERKSFFRRLAENKGSPRIDYEVVLIQRRLPVEGVETCP